MNDKRTSEQVTATFVRGLTIGALLGAVIAGSSIWSRRAARRRRVIVDLPVDAAPPPRRARRPSVKER